ncbi:MAG: hypothetical protein JXX28_05865 [Deltaproteobacteria bacterium]|nr:hypothetical protein [Deltaproteobacteria bacterium]
MRMLQMLAVVSLGSLYATTLVGCGEKEETGETDTDTDTDTDSDTDTDTDTDSDTDTDTDADTGVEAWVLAGAATVSDGTYTGTTSILDLVANNTAGNYNVGDKLCEIVYPASTSGDGVSTYPCENCDFAIVTTHGAPTTWQGDLCDDWYGDASYGFTDGSWMNEGFLGFGFNPSYTMEYGGQSYGPYATTMALMDDGYGVISWGGFAIDATFTDGNFSWQRVLGYYAY